MDIESCGGGIRFLAPILIVWGYVGIYRRKEYVGGATGGPWGRGRAPTLVTASFVPWSRAQVSWITFVPKKLSRRFHSVWIPFGIPFLRNTKIGKKTETGTGPPVNRLVPKII